MSGKSLLSFYIVGRDQWGADPAIRKVALRRPAVYVRTVVLSQERKCYNQDECFETLREMQQRDITNGLTDIRANFLIGDDARVYEGRGWFAAPPDHPNPYFNKDYIEIAHIGGAPDEVFRTELVKLKLQLLEYGMKHKYIALYHSIIT